MPDHPDDLPELDLSLLKPENEIAGLLHYFANKPDEEGLSYVQRQEMNQQKAIDLAHKKLEAKIQLQADSGPFPCICYPECLGSECIQSVAQRKEAEETYKRTLAALEPKPNPSSNKAPLSKGPTISTSKAAAVALSQPKRLAPAGKSASQSSAPVRKPISIAPRSKKPLPPTNPSSMRHTAASAASRTTMGYSKGRATSAAMRKSEKDLENEAEIDPHQLSLEEFIHHYGIPKIGSDKWVECKRAGCFDEDEETLGDEIAARDRLADMFREEAQKEFILEF